MTKKYVVMYESADDVREKAPLHFTAHQARWKHYSHRGELLMIATFSDLSGSMAVFTAREAATPPPPPHLPGTSTDRR